MEVVDCNVKRSLTVVEWLLGVALNFEVGYTLVSKIELVDG